ncbi:MAG: hypothetical protein FH748_12305 [Balneolaceae bacterium]|nr:hypothetical protein [Balneolaceae bacterium]
MINDRHSRVDRHTLESYQGYNAHVYRYTADDDYKIGSSKYPVAPLLYKANSLVGKHSYSYDTAILFMFLCVARWEREEWIRKMEDFLKKHIEIISPAIIEVLFKYNYDKLIRLLEWFADEIICQIIAFRKDKGLVCSETVALIYNEANPVGKYHIEKPLTASTSPPSKKAVLKVNVAAKESLDRFISLLEETDLMLSTHDETLD